MGPRPATSTGSHAMKSRHHRRLGPELAYLRTETPTIDAPDQDQTSPVWGNDLPFQAVVYNTPATAIQNVNSDFGSYAQDTWTDEAASTLNYGGRASSTSTPPSPQNPRPASTVDRRPQLFRRFRTCRTGTTGRSAWAAAYDLFGNGQDPRSRRTPGS